MILMCAVSRLFRSTLVVLAGAVALGAFWGCQPGQQALDYEDDRNPYFRKAGQLLAEDDFHNAIREYEKALQASAKAQRAHVLIGQIYSEKLGDPISAIYHYQKYLNARPESMDRTQVQNYIETAKIDFAITLPHSPLQNSEESAKLHKDNVELKQSLAQVQSLLAKREQQIANLEQRLKSAGIAVAENVPTVPGIQPSNPPVPVAIKVEPSPGPLPATPAPAPAAPATAQGGKSHTIQKGETLWGIARQFFPNDVKNGVDKILAANPGSTAQNLKPGQTLVIPE